MCVLSYDSMLSNSVYAHRALSVEQLKVIFFSIPGSGWVSHTADCSVSSVLMSIQS